MQVCLTAFRIERLFFPAFYFIAILRKSVEGVSAFLYLCDKSRGSPAMTVVRVTVEANIPIRLHPPLYDP